MCMYKIFFSIYLTFNSCPVFLNSAHRAEFSKKTRKSLRRGQPLQGRIGHHRGAGNGAQVPKRHIRPPSQQPLVWAWFGLGSFQGLSALLRACVRPSDHARGVLQRVCVAQLVRGVLDRDGEITKACRFGR